MQTFFINKDATCDNAHVYQKKEKHAYLEGLWGVKEVNKGANNCKYLACPILRHENMVKGVDRDHSFHFMSDKWCSLVYFAFLFIIAVIIDRSSRKSIPGC